MDTNSSGILFFDVDTQYDFISSDGALSVAGAEEIVPNLKTLTQLAMQKGIKVFASMDTHATNDPEFKDFPPHCVAKTPGSAKTEETKCKNIHTVHLGDDLGSEELEQVINKSQQVEIEKDSLDVFQIPITTRI